LQDQVVYFSALIDLYILSFYLLHGLILLLLLMASALVSGTEAAFFSLSQQQIAQCKNSHEPRSSKVLKLLQSPRRLLATILILNNLINVAFVTLSIYLLWQVFGMGYIPSFVLLTFTLLSTGAIVLFGEIIPKTYANQHNLQFAKRFVGFLHVAVLILRPLSSLLMRVSTLFGQGFFQEQYDLSIDQLNRAVEITTTKGSSAEDKKILKGVINFTTLAAKQIMQPRTEITAVDIAMDFHQLINMVNKSGYSRFPVYKETIDQIEGFLYIKDLLPYLEKGKHFPWKTLLRKCLFIPENKKLDTLLLEFQASKVHMAIVVDEYGGTSGLVTMEDVIEEIIGEIADEFDQDEEIGYRQIDSKTFEFEGKVPLHDFCKVVGVNSAVFETIKGESESLGGLLLEINGRLPQANEKIVYKQFTFVVMAADTRRIKKVRVHIEPAKQQLS